MGQATATVENHSFHQLTYLHVYRLWEEAGAGEYWIDGMLLKQQAQEEGLHVTYVGTMDEQNTNIHIDQETAGRPLLTLEV